MIPKLIMFSGLPGTGKTALARQVAAYTRLPLLAKDRVQRALRDHTPDSDPASGYYLLQDLADEQIALGMGAVLDAVYPMPEFRDAAREMVESYRGRMYAIYCHCSDEAIWRELIRNRTSFIPGWDPVGWSEVERLRQMFVPWGPNEALMVDAVNSLDANLEAVLNYING